MGGGAARRKTWVADAYVGEREFADEKNKIPSDTPRDLYKSARKMVIQFINF
jgi:hypothetical protein